VVEERELTTDQKGNIAEAFVIAHAIRLGIEVYRPAGEGGRFDMIFRFGDGRLERVQVKWAPLQGGVVVVRPYSSRRTADGLRSRMYTADEIDAIAAYCPQLDQVYYLPVSLAGNRKGVHLRVDPPRNGQRGSLNWASAYELGAIAQLGERRYGIPKVAGSSPASSTGTAADGITIGCHEFRNRFGWYAERAHGGEEIVVTRHGRPYLRLVPPQAPLPVDGSAVAA
jgi:prevent-host-death family protein